MMLLNAGNALAQQWKGQVGLEGGLGRNVPIYDGFDPLWHGLGQGNASATYTSPKFEWNVGLNGKFENLDTDNSRFFISVTDPEKEKMSAVYKFNRSRPVTGRFNTSGLWKPRPGVWYKATLSYDIRAERGDNLIYREEISGKVDKVNVDLQDPFKSKHEVKAGFEMDRHLGSARKVLHGTVNAGTVFQQERSRWATMRYEGEDDEKGYLEKAYRLTPQSGAADISANFYYADSLIHRKDMQLRLAPGLRLKAAFTSDNNSGATLVDYEKDIWADSTRLRESFNFLTINFQPYVMGDFRWKSLSVHINYSLDLYARKLTDNDAHRDRKMDFVTPYPFGDGWVKWTISPMHSLTLSNKIEVFHPAYLQICWYERQGNYPSQMYRGKETLKSREAWKYALTYDFKYSRFLSTTMLAATRNMNEVDQTYTNETINNIDYKVFTWLNASNSWNFEIEEKLGWRGKWVNANIDADFKHNMRQSITTGEVKRNNEWRLTADATGKFGKGWQVGADVRYQSKVANFFTIFQGYCTLNARVQKQLGNWTLTLRGQDLLDNPRETQFISDDQTEGWIESSRLNRRMVILGATWKF